MSHLSQWWHSNAVIRTNLLMKKMENGETIQIVKRLVFKKNTLYLNIVKRFIKFLKKKQVIYRFIQLKI